MVEKQQYLTGKLSSQDTLDGFPTTSIVSPEFEDLNVIKPSLSVIKPLKERGFVRPSSPFWWSTDYAPDPREYMKFDDFNSRLVRLGEYNTLSKEIGWEYREVRRDIHLYPHPQVPITVIELPVERQLLPFLITARPYHLKERFDNPHADLLFTQNLETLPKYLASGGKVDLPDHFYPHIRGLFAGRRGNHIFWYPLRPNTFWYEFGQNVRAALDAKGLNYVEIYDAPYVEERRYPAVWNELLNRKTLVDQRKPAWMNFGYEAVSAEEFLERWDSPSKEDPVVFYPLRVAGIEHTLPLVIAARTHKESPVRHPTVLGIVADNGLTGFCARGGICRIKDTTLAQSISKLISADFKTPVDTVLFIPSKGRPKYERISVAA